MKDVTRDGHDKQIRIQALQDNILDSFSFYLFKRNMSQIQTYRSSVSQHSRSAMQMIQDTFELTDLELIQLVNECKQQIKILTIENEIIEKTIMRLDPTLMQGVTQALEYAAKLHSNSSFNLGSTSKSYTSRLAIGESFLSPSRIIRSPSRASTRKIESSARLGTMPFGSGVRINILEKFELLSIEIGRVLSDLDKSKRNAAKKQALLKAQLEEISLREADIERASKAFNQDVIIEGWDKIAQRIPAEIWIRFMTEWVKICDSQIGKLRLRTSTLNTQHSKLKGQINFKAELSDSLRPVDFEKLKIENSEAIKLIELKFQQLVELKSMTGDANLNLTIHKKEMMAQNSYLNSVIKTIKQKKNQTVQLIKEKNVIEVQANNLAVKLEEVRKVRNAWEVPDIMDYVRVKSEVTELLHVIKMLSNRLHIQQIALASINKSLRAD